MLNIEFSFDLGSVKAKTLLHSLCFTCAVNSVCQATSMKRFLVKDVGTVHTLLFDSQTEMVKKQFNTNNQNKQEHEEKYHADKTYKGATKDSCWTVVPFSTDWICLVSLFNIINPKHVAIAQ